ncbi:hypothetical protein [Youxingia wuxianensis]|uniref:Uncharacterized protein n=1 Tax=Youxingia wuxianensis TaxID=2763678 RepID=A0A926EQX7_9FIRM|nr:hypothetical protein [Youxingia wuxianensis]MBC8584899.1 hypothetical protein [Youxingia wuxianensis]
MTKIFAFGGDCNFSDEAYGHQVLARKQVALVLSQKMEDGLFTSSQAEKIAEDLFYGNAARLYHI